MQADLRSSGALFGELLGRRVPLSSHDVFEILEEQGGSHRRFGQVALGWGLCEPRHVWETWAEQLAGRTPRVDLGKMGIDVQATLHLSGTLAADLGIVPVRAHAGGLVVAASERTIARAAERLAHDAGRQVTFVLAEPAQIRQALERYYPDALIQPRIRAACDDRPCADRCAGATCARRRPPSVPDAPAVLRTAG
jgi:MshEN domain